MYWSINVHGLIEQAFYDNVPFSNNDIYPCKHVTIRVLYPHIHNTCMYTHTSICAFCDMLFSKVVALPAHPRALSPKINMLLVSFNTFLSSFLALFLTFLASFNDFLFLSCHFLLFFRIFQRKWSGINLTLYASVCV